MKSAKTELRRRALALLKDAKFYARLSSKLADLGVIGERLNALALFTACQTKSLKMPVSVLLKGDSASGKSSLVNRVLMLIPSEEIIRRASLSAKAPVHGADSLEEKILFVLEYRGGKDAQYLLRLLQTEGAISHEFTTVSGNVRSTEVATRGGQPVVLTTTTESEVFADDETRFLTLWSDDSPELTRSVLRARIASGAVMSEPTPTEAWQEAFRLLTLRKYAFLYPQWFAKVVEGVPVEKPRARRDWERFLSIVQAVCVCQSFARGQWQQRELEIEFADYCIAHELINRALSHSFYGAREKELAIAVAVRELHTRLGRPVTVKEIARQLGQPLPQQSLYRNVRDARARRFIRQEEVTHERNLKRYYPGLVEAGDFLPKPQSVLDACGDVAPNQSYFHPTTGILIRLVRNGARAASARAGGAGE